MLPEIKLIFDSEKDRKKWLGWYIDGGGEQESEFYTIIKKSDWKKFSYLKLEYQPLEKGDV